MTPEEWARAREVFDAAVARQPAERQAFVDEACAGNPRVRAEVVSLLAAHDRSTDFIERPVFEAAAELLVDHPDESSDGRMIGPYVVRHEMGRGGMGVVYLAEDTRLARRVALKALPTEIGRDPRLRERLRHEARAAAALSHPGIATVYAIEEIDGDLYLASEHVPGPTLRALIESGPLPIGQVVDIAVQLARALVAAHAQGIVHRDLKPDNVVRTAAGLVKVLDFGVSRVESLVGPHLTADGDMPGTPAYMAPEQIRGEAVDFRADLFSLGVLLYELASGANPFAATTRTATMARILEAQPEPLSQACGAARPTFDAEVERAAAPVLDRIVAVCISKQPLDRYGSTLELASELEQLQSDILARRRRDPAQAARRVPASRWWWEFHQLIVSAIYVLTMLPAWRARSWLPVPWGTVFLLGALTCAAISTTLRLHLWFTSRFYPAELSTERRRAWIWTRLCDVGMAGALLLATLRIGAEHQATAMLLLTIAIGTALAAFVIEPATTRATFRVQGR